ncbi:MAG TPA: FtsQ-type POTRA domain-containing protein, partial [Desulfosarcina sp.]|nr:FtsQ-type POTRA domain-containing protein [Desulfosarcina sp.]
NRRLTHQQVLDIGRIGLQTNILSVNLAVTRKRLLADPWIAEATVSRQIPSGLHLQILEETPLAALEMGSGEELLINVAGEVFQRRASSEASEWPRVRGLEHADLPVNGQPGTPAFDAVMTLLRLAGEAECPLPLKSIRRIDIDREIGATVIAGPDDRAVRLGFGHYRRKCEALGELMGRLRNDSRLKHYRMIDLLDVNRIVVTLASAAGADDAVDKEV